MDISGWRVVSVRLLSLYFVGSRAFKVEATECIYRVLQTIQMKLIPLCVWAERAVFGSAKTAFRFKYEI
jgi:hypothetical protein